MQEIDKNAPVQESEVDDEHIPEYMKTCIQLSINESLGEKEVRDRCFHLLSGGAIFGICIGELPDSFLVSSSCQLVSESGKIDGKPFARAKVIRLFRNSIAFISIPDKEHRYYYFKWLKKQFADHSEFFNKERRDIIEKYVYAYENSKTKVEQSDVPEDDVQDVEEESASMIGPNSFWSIHNSTEFH